ncbi:unnamed protein product [Tilletia controversa]|uniref:Major facilitator superfamily (MFS) profile domain-containing protein n=3 Tax=Tilletia TaxID=13289 RepID=A0A8X7MXV2_9BASI|nr:hypothetical protein CF336_g343 [Tilletia laevis]KAE8203071.1 hypothetical protein CF328_g1857 [Tilletia controversa]KAE8263959.1 hypothetical protein A4X03_0g1296 [Tilletia caries]KAE8207537.1 hypothetical protein CF335_g1066 [Tilletia laevis]KAE8252242.1 hypothetical protein A4X06_0g2331 [Tilletia controversa]
MTSKSHRKASPEHNSQLSAIKADLKPTDSEGGLAPSLSESDTDLETPGFEQSPDFDMTSPSNKKGKAGQVSGTLTPADLAAEEQEEEADKDAKKKDKGKKKDKRRQREAERCLAKNLPESRKWVILSVIMLIQISMNFNTSAYSSGTSGIAKEFGVTEQAARVGQALFLVFYAIGSLLWAPWSEELGRKWVLQLSLFLVNVFQLPVALAPNFASILVGRFFGGLFSAGGSVTLGTMADMWEPEHQGPAVIAVVFASVFGAAIGPIPCNALAEFAGWRWTIWLQLILGVAAQGAHLFLVPETRSTILMGREIERREREGLPVDGIEKPDRMEFTMKNIFVIWYRPFEMLIREPIVLCLSLLSGYSDALIFTALEAFTLVYKQWGFTNAQIGAAYVPIVIGYVIAALSYFIPYYRFKRLLRENKKVTPEFRLWWLLFLAPFLSIGLFGFAWTSWPRVHWLAPMFFTVLIGIANYAIYLSSIDYSIVAYGPYSSSATAGNAFARDGIAGAATMYAVPLYEKLGLQWASTLLGFIALFVVIPVYVFYIYGERIRLASPFAQELAKKKEEDGDDDDDEEDQQEDEEGAGHRSRA